MSRELKDKIVVVTGGADGLGFEITKNFLHKGAKTAIILDVNEDKGKESVKTLTSDFGEGKAEFIKCDVTKDLDEVTQKILDKYKYVDVLVNNAGVFKESAIKLSIDVNTIAVIEWSYKYLDHMRTDKGGKGGTIINVSSIYGFRINQFLPIYQASKFAVFGFSKSLGHNYNYEKFGVRVVALCPGLTTTNMATKSSPPREPELMMEDMVAYSIAEDWQEPSDLGRGAVEVFEKAESGSAWLVEGGRPAVEVPYNF